MKLSSVLQETPLPSDWDKDTFVTKNSSFAKRVKYAKERAKTLGSGSSRIAFEIEYQGRPTVIKIAKNAKGFAQNEFEAQMLEDWYLKRLDITIPMIDYDEVNNKPSWIHVEKAEKMTVSKFRKFFDGYGFRDVLNMVEYGTGKSRTLFGPTEDEFQEMIEENEYLVSLIDLVGNYDIPPNDFGVKANWGIYKNEPVIIDIGLSTEVYKLHYS